MNGFDKALGKCVCGPLTRSIYYFTLLLAPAVSNWTALTAASLSLYSSLHLRLSRVHVEVPAHWTELECSRPLELNARPLHPYETDLVVADDHPVRGNTTWTQQTLGCQRKGDFIYLPRSLLQSTSVNDSEIVRQVGRAIRHEWVRYRYGVFATWEHHDDHLQLDQCYGRSVRNVVRSHPVYVQDVRAAEDSTFQPPSFVFVRSHAPRMVLVLENSRAMDALGSWESIRTSLRKFILHDLSASTHLGLVLFNRHAHVTHQVVQLSNATQRESVAILIENSFKLSSDNSSCVKCGIASAIEALDSSESNARLAGATLLVLSQAKSTSVSNQEEREIIRLAEKHRLRIHALAVVNSNDLSTALENIAHKTNGISAFVHPDDHNNNEHEGVATVDPEAALEARRLRSYVGLVEALREVEARTTLDGPALLHERTFEAFSSGPERQDGDSFVVDKYSGRDTEFLVFSVNARNGFLRAVDIKDAKGQTHGKGIFEDNNLKTKTVRGVPFGHASNVGMRWRYMLDRMSSHRLRNTHVVRVTSRARRSSPSSSASSSSWLSHEALAIRFFTNMEAHMTRVSDSTPLQLFVEVLVRGVPVLDARVRLGLQARDQKGKRAETIMVHLLDNGNGDPDCVAGDGIYSRYLSDFSAGEGRYDVIILVDNDLLRATTFAAVQDDANGSCCTMAPSMSSTSAPSSPSVLKLGSFSRIVSGDSFRIASIDASQTLPPSRILTLSHRLITTTQILEFTFMAPGSDLDSGQVRFYELFQSRRSPEYLFNISDRYVPKEVEMVETFEATVAAGHTETLSISIEKYENYDVNVYYAIRGVDEEGNRGIVSNVCIVLVPLPQVDDDSLNVDNDHDYDNNLVGGHSYRQHRVISVGRPEKVLLFIMAGLGGFIVLCIILVFCIVVSYKRQKAAEDEEDGGLADEEDGLNETVMRSMGVSTAATNLKPVNNMFGLHSDVDDPLSNAMLRPTHLGGSVVSFADDQLYATNSSNYSNSGYGWTNYNNPYVMSPTLNTLNGVLTSNSVYARPMPKHQRVLNSTPAASSNGNNSSNRSVLINTNNATVNNTASLLSNTNGDMNGLMNAGSTGVASSLSTASSAAEQTRLIPSGVSTTPTKSILKKPKTVSTPTNSALMAPLCRHENDLLSSSQSNSSSIASSSQPEELSSQPSVSPTQVVAGTQDDDNKPYSPSSTLLETSFEHNKVNNNKSNNNNEEETKTNTIDRRVRNITQV